MRVVSPYIVTQGRVPTCDQIGIVYRALRSSLEHAPFVVAASTYGSAVTGNISRLSDIDAVVVYRKRDVYAARRWRARFIREQELYHVPISITLLTSENLSAEKPEDGGSTYLASIRAFEQAGGIIVGDGVTPYFKLKRPDIWEDFCGYMRGRSAALQEALEAQRRKPRKRDYVLLGNIVSQAVHASRKYLQCLDVPGAATMDAYRIYRALDQALKGEPLERAHQMLDARAQYKGALDNYLSHVEDPEWIRYATNPEKLVPRRTYEHALDTALSHGDDLIGFFETFATLHA